MQADLDEINRPEGIDDMTLVWEDLRAELEERLESFEVIWALLWHAQGGTLNLSLVEPLDRDLQLTGASEALSLALVEVERVRPEVRFLCLPGEPGRVPLDDVSQYRAGICEFLDAALSEIARVLRQKALELSLDELSALASVASVTGQARVLVREVLR